MKTRRMAVLLLALALPLGACETVGQREGVGAVLGAAGGGLLGSQFGSGSGQMAMTALGAVGGLLLGSSIGRTMDDVDRIKHGRTAVGALEYSPSGTTSTWRNPDRNTTGSFTPTRTWQAEDGRYCREFTQLVTIAGRTEQAYGTACREPDGTWRIVG